MRLNYKINIRNRKQNREVINQSCKTDKSEEIMGETNRAPLYNSKGNSLIIRKGIPVKNSVKKVSLKISKITMSYIFFYYLHLYILLCSDIGLCMDCR